MTLSTSANTRAYKVGPPIKTLRSESSPRTRKTYRKDNTTVAAIIIDQTLI